MKTKYILHGGYTGTVNDSNQEYFEEMVADVTEGGNILLVYFASKDEDVDRKYEQDTHKILTIAGDKKITVIKASPENFIDQVENADVIYIRGGDTEKLKDVLSEYENLREIIKGKTLSGSSAGAYVFSDFYYSNSLNEVKRGLGYLPIKIVCHYQSDRHNLVSSVNPISELEKIENNLELIVLKDYEWVVRETNS